ncbi:plasminogen-binding N-terminal domain-containing protein [Campylobacterota bacterium DY0563]
MKLLTKTLFALFATSILSQGLLAKTTICYKKDWKSPATIETTKLDGGECKNELSYKDMLSQGWFLKDIKIEKGTKGLNYIYVFSDKEIVNINNSNLLNNKYQKLDYRAIASRISDVNDETAKIDIGNLRVGQSAIIQHFYKNNQSLIVSNAYVIDSNETSSTIKFIPFLDIKQNALPTSNRKPQNGDIAIVNYLYNASLIVAPSQDAFTATREKFRDNNFIHSDLFAVYLKNEGIPLPSKKVIQDYAISQNLGTIFFVIDSTVYIVDAKTFAILQKDTIAYNFVENKKMPFYTRIEKIESNIINSVLDYKSWLGKIEEFLGADNRTEEEILLEDQIASGELKIDAEVYANYYKTILGIK